MKDQDHKTNSVCFCKGNNTLEVTPKKDVDKVVFTSDDKDKIDNVAQKPWSMFEGWYWL